MKSNLGLPDGDGVLPDQWINKAISCGVVYSSGQDIPQLSVQPASLDLRLGPKAYRLQCSFLPGQHSVETKLGAFGMDTIDISNGGILERNRPYLIPLQEELHLPGALRAKSNPKSSTGRLDIFTRVITDGSHRFDEIRPGYKGRLFLEVVSRSFTIRVQEGLSLNQLRLITTGTQRLNDQQLRQLLATKRLLFQDGKAIPAKEISVADGLFMSLDLRKGGDTGVGYRAGKNSRLLDLSKVDHYEPSEFWDVVYPEEEDRVILEPEEFYLLLSWESVRIPPEYAAEMTAYDPTAGELRTHYAGFFDPGFGHGPSTGLPHGSRAALEVRAHDVPFVIEHAQPVCKLSFERMLERPTILYGLDISSNYQLQDKTLSKHFKTRRPILEGQPRFRLS